VRSARTGSRRIHGNAVGRLESPDFFEPCAL
jgi:hypothetical protein